MEQNEVYGLNIPQQAHENIEMKKNVQYGLPAGDQQDVYENPL